MATNPWMWQDGRNPYLSTPFQVLALDVELRGRAAIRHHIRNRRRRIQSAAQRFPLFGRTLSEAEINEAEEQIQDPPTRLLAELLTHRPRAASVSVDDLRARLDALRSDSDEPDLRVDWAALRWLLPPPAPRTFTPLWTDNAG